LASWDDVQPDLEEKCQLNPGDPACVKYFSEKAAYLRKARAPKKAKKGGDELNLDDAFQTGGDTGGGIQRAGSGGGLATVDPFGSNTGQAGAIADVFAGDKKRAAAPIGKMADAPVV